MKKFMILFWNILLATTLCQAAYAQDDVSDVPWERLSVSLGYLTAASDSDVRIGRDALGTGISIDVEDALNLDTTHSAANLDVKYRFGRKRHHRVGLSILDFRREGSVILDEDIEIGDPPITLPAGSKVKTSYDTSIIKADYGYSFFIDERINLAASGGIYVIPIELGIKNVNTGERSDTSISAPLPTLGMSLELALSPKWLLRQNYDLFYLKIGSYSGNIFATKLAVEWNVWEHWGFGASLDTFSLDVESRKEDESVPGVDFIGDIQISFRGLMLYTRYRF